MPIVWLSGTRQRSAIVAAFAFACSQSQSQSSRTLSHTRPYGCLLPQHFGFRAACPRTSTPILAGHPLGPAQALPRRPPPAHPCFDSGSLFPRRGGRLHGLSVANMLLKIDVSQPELDFLRPDRPRNRCFCPQHRASLTDCCVLQSPSLTVQNTSTESRSDLLACLETPAFGIKAFCGKDTFCWKGYKSGPQLLHRTVSSTLGAA